MHGHESSPRIVDSETPEYVMPGWMAPDNRVSTILTLVDVDVVYNEVDRTEPISCGAMAASPRRTSSRSHLLLSESTTGEGVRILGGERGRSVGVCLRGGGRVLVSARGGYRGERLTIRVFYARTESPIHRPGVDDTAIRTARPAIWSCAPSGAMRSSSIWERPGCER